MATINALAGIAVRELDAGIEWYRRLLDRQPDSRPMPEVAEWEFPRGGWIQVFADAARAGSSSVTLAEDDLDARVADLDRKNIPIRRRSDSAITRVAIVADPDGNQVVFAQQVDPANRSVG